jgi:hypothetical protein
MGSYEIKELMTRQFLFQKRQFHDPIFRQLMERVIKKRTSFDVTIIGPTPTMYSPKQAPSSWVLLGVIQKFGERYGRGFQYLQAELTDDAEVDEGRSLRR